MVQRKKLNKPNPTRYRQLLKRWCPALLISLAALMAAPWLLGPRCPTHIVIATGQQDGAYYAFASQYKEILAEHGITLEVRSTAGSVENQQLLNSDSSGVSLAIIQGGTADRAKGRLQSLASLYPEPVWVFCRSDDPVDELAQLQGKSIAVGPKGSGTRSIALKLLADNHISEEDHQTSFVDFGATESSQKLKTGEIDVAFIVISPEAPVIHDLLKADGIQLVSFRRAAAYQQKHGFLSESILPEGIVSFHHDVPNRDIRLLAPTANMVARDDLHHALVPLILQAVEQVHQSDGILVQSESFPTPQFTDYPLNKDADRYFRSGPSLLYRYLPFWLAAWLDRVKLILLPMCTLLIPLIKVAPPVYRWRIRSKIYRWYRVLHEIDLELKDADRSLDLSGCLRRLNKLEQELFEVSVPLSYMEEFYNLRLHVSFVKNRLSELEGGTNFVRKVA
jgi:TRAP transporter TAXI family solute receptor